MPRLTAPNGDCIEIYYEEWGSGQPLVLIGGLTSTVETWGLQAPALAQRYRTIAPDNRGSGRTRIASDDGVRTPARFAADVRALLDGLEIERAHLIGASMGGTIVQEFALCHPERLLTLTIACSTFGGPHSVRASAEVLNALFAGSAEGASEADRERATRVVVHPDTPSRRPECLDFYLRTKQLHPHSSEEIARRAAGFADFDVHDRIGSLRMPTLVIAGGDDVLIPTENALLLAERIPGAELVIIPEAGHIFFAEQPDTTNRALLDFLDRHATLR